MRVTIDVDKKKLAMEILTKGIEKLGRVPDEIRISASGKGFHYIWNSLDVSFEDSLQLREEIGDDPNRVRIDRACGLKPQQVLWTSKVMSDGSVHVAKTISLEEFLEIF